MKKNILKKTGIGLLAICLLYLLLLLVTGLYVNSQKEQIRQYAAQLLNEKLNGQVYVGGIDISVWKKFPLINFSMENFSWKDSVSHSPVLTLQRLSTSFNIFQVIFSSRTIRNLEIQQGSLHIFTDSTGYTNAYLLSLKNKITAGTGTASKSEINIDNFSAKDLDIIIEDKLKAKEISMSVKRLTATISQLGSLVAIHMQEQVLMKKGLGFNLVKGAYLENQSIEAKWLLSFDMDKKQLSFSNTNTRIDGHLFGLSGHFIFSKTEPSFLINLESKNVLFPAVEKIVTRAIREKLERYQVAGPLDVKGSIEGSLLAGQDPKVNIDCSTINNRLHSSFADFTNCRFSGNFTNRLNPDSGCSDKNSQISFTDFSADWERIAVSAKTIAVNNLDSPWLKARVYANASMEALDNKLALTEIAFEKGHAIFDLSYDGLLTDGSPSFEKVQGTIEIKTASVNYVPRDFDFNNCNGLIHLFKDSISMRGFTCNYLGNQFTINVDGSNMRSKFITPDSARPSLITASVVSPAVNLGDFTALFAGKKTRRKGASADKQMFALSRKIDAFIGNSIIDITLKAGSIKNQHLAARNFATHIRFEQAEWLLSKIAMEAGGGFLQAKGKININPNGNHRASLQVTVDNAAISKLLYAFDNFGQQAVTYQDIDGNFITAADLQLDISGAGHVVPASMHGVIDFSLKNGSLRHFTPFERLKTFVFKKRNLDDVRFAELKDRFTINGDTLYINRMEVQSSVFRLFIEGNYGFNKKNTDLLIQVPFSNLNNNSFSVDSVLQNKGTQERKSGNVWLRAVNTEDGKIKLKLTLNRKLKAKQ